MLSFMIKLRRSLVGWLMPGLLERVAVLEKSSSELAHDRRMAEQEAGAMREVANAFAAAVDEMEATLLAAEAQVAQLAPQVAELGRRAQVAEGEAIAAKAERDLYMVGHVRPREGQMATLVSGDVEVLDARGRLTVHAPQDLPPADYAAIGKTLVEAGAVYWQVGSGDRAVAWRVDALYAPQAGQTFLQALRTLMKDKPWQEAGTTLAGRDLAPERPRQALGEPR